MNESIRQLVVWFRSNIEISAVITSLIAVATYVGNFYYTSYFEFYFIDIADVAIPFSSSMRSFFIVFIVSATLIGMVVSREHHKSNNFSAFFRDNIPLFILLMLLSGYSINIYLGNVQFLSEWLSASLKDASLRVENERLTQEVTRFLKRALLFVPLLISLLVIVVLSLRKFSFSVFLMSRAVGFRIMVLGLCVLLVLEMASISGRIVGFLEFTGVIKKPVLIVTLSDGKVFQEGLSLYLVSKSDSIYYIAARATDAGTKMRIWQVPQSTVKQVEFYHDMANPKPFLDYIN